MTVKKQSIVNLVKYYVDRNDEAFRTEVAEIAMDFERSGDVLLAEHLMDLISTTDYYVPQTSYKNFAFLKKVNFSGNPLWLPTNVEEDIVGLVRSINNKIGLNKILFYGKPGSGKTETAYQIARLLERDALSVNLEQLVDSKLGQTAKNISALFEEINRVSGQRAIIVLDEIDSIVLDRINSSDLREMGRVTSTFLREFERLCNDIVIIATTNLIDSFDKALIRRFDAIISFDRYTKDDLIEIANSILALQIKKVKGFRLNTKLFNKILKECNDLPYPGDLLQIIKTSIAFADSSYEYDYLRKIYFALHQKIDVLDIQFLQMQGYTTREIEIITRIPKSSVSRKLKA